EIVTGKHAFEGKSQASVIAAIMERDPPSVAGVAPAALDRLLHQCMTKDPEDRWQTARDLKRGLEWIGENETGLPAAASRRRVWRKGAWWIITFALLIATLLLAVGNWRALSTGELVRFAVYPPEG